MYVEKEAPILMWPDGSVRAVCYRCMKCGKWIYLDGLGEAWKVYEPMKKKQA